MAVIHPETLTNRETEALDQEVAWLLRILTNPRNPERASGEFPLYPLQQFREDLTLAFTTLRDEEKRASFIADHKDALRESEVPFSTARVNTRRVGIPAVIEVISVSLKEVGAAADGVIEAELLKALQQLLIEKSGEAKIGEIVVRLREVPDSTEIPNATETELRAFIDLMEDPAVKAA